jgi:hypothetical protein
VTGAILPAWTVQTVVNTTAITPLTNSNSNPFPFADPCPNTVKQLMVQETSSVQTITVNGASVIVPALPSVLAACPLPPSDPVGGPVSLIAAINAVAIPNQPVCSLAPNAVAITSDGGNITDGSVSTPVFTQYCIGSACGSPFMMFPKIPMLVSASNPTFTASGVKAVSGTAGILYAIPTSAAYSILYTDPTGAKHTSQIPAAPSN